MPIWLLYLDETRFSFGWNLRFPLFAREIRQVWSPSSKSHFGKAFQATAQATTIYQHAHHTIYFCALLQRRGPLLNGV